MSIEQSGFKTISRAEILRCLNGCRGNDTLMVSYRKHLQGIEDSVMSYKTLPEKKWGWNAWQGFYKELESRVDIDSWGYVANPSGGFLGAWWHFIDEKDCTMYLQREHGKLCFKISYEGEGDRSEVRFREHIKLMKLAQGRFPEIRRPDRFGTGTYMTIAVVDEESLFGNGPVNFDKLTTKLKEYETLVDNCCTSNVG